MSDTASPFDPELDDLPETLPVFPLPGVLLLPGGRLPLNIFEPRYLRMVEDALAGSRLIGMVQPVLEDEGEGEFAALEAEAGGELDESAGADPALADPGSAALYATGCAGRIVAFSETDDGRYLITLRGLIRFRVREELSLVKGYRRVVPAFAPFADDLTRQRAIFDRQRLLEALRSYFDQQGIEADWDAIREASNERLVTSLAMVCPFSSAEKQALLEASDLSKRAETMTAILEMAVLGTGPAGAEAARH
jgi:Lon protease-like protein